MGRQAQLRDHAAAKPLPVSALTGLGHRLERGALGHGRGLVAAAARCLMLCMAWPPMACEAAKQWSLCLHLALQAHPSSPCSLVAALPRLATLGLMQRLQPVCASRRVHLLLWQTPCLMGIGCVKKPPAASRPVFAYLPPPPPGDAPVRASVCVCVMLLLSLLPVAVLHPAVSRAAASRAHAVFVVGLIVVVC